MSPSARTTHDHDHDHDADPVADPIAVALAFHRAVEEGHHGEDLRGLVDPGVVLVEHPNPVTPRGARSGWAEMLAQSRAGAELLARQHYDVHDASALGDTAVLRLTWTGEVAADRGPFRAGQRLTAEIAQFVTVAQGRITRIETFDCYHPFA